MVDRGKIRKRSMLKAVGGASVTALSGCIGNLGSRGTNDYPNQPIELIIPFGPGGGFDFYARLLAEVLTEQEYVPVAVKPRNVEGAAGKTGTNLVWNADPNGYTIGIQHGTLLPLDPITNPEVVEYDPTEITYLPRVGGTTRAVAVSTETEITTGDEFLSAAREENIVFSHQGPESAPALQMLSLAILGGPATFTKEQYERNSVGYDSRGEEYTALLRGEVQVLNGSFRSLREYVEAGDLRFVLFFTRDGECPDDVANSNCDTLETLDANVENIDQIISFTGGQCHRYFIAPPNLPTDHQEYLCDIISKAIRDPMFSDRARSAGRGIFYGDCETTRECVINTHRTFEERRELLAEFGFID